MAFPIPSNLFDFICANTTAIFLLYFRQLFSMMLPTAAHGMEGRVREEHRRRIRRRANDFISSVAV